MLKKLCVIVITSHSVIAIRLTAADAGIGCYEGPFQKLNDVQLGD